MNNPYKNYFKKHFFFRYLYIKKKIQFQLRGSCVAQNDFQLIRSQRAYIFKKAYLKSGEVYLSIPKIHGVVKNHYGVIRSKLEVSEMFFLLLSEGSLILTSSKGGLGRLTLINSRLPSLKRNCFRLNSNLSLTNYFNYLLNKFNSWCLPQTFNSGYLKFGLNPRYVQVDFNLSKLILKGCVLRKGSEVNRFTEILKLSMFQYDPFNSIWFLEGRDKILNFLSKNLKVLEVKYGFFTNKGLYKAFPDLRFNHSLLILGKKKHEMFLSIKTFSKNSDLFKKFNNLIICNTYFFVYKKITYLIDRNLINFLLKLEVLFLGSKVLYLTNFKYFVHPCRVVSLYAMLRYFLGDIKLPRSWVYTLRFLWGKKYQTHKILKGYQGGGVLWLRVLHRLGLGGVLADEMGLGKTIQSLYFLNNINSYLKTPSMVMCPKSLVANWVSEVRKFNVSRTRIVVLGKNDDFRKKNMFNFLKDCGSSVTFLTSLTFVESNYFYFYNIHYNSIIMDEAHTLKNTKSLVFTTLRRLKSYSKFLLTGTPFKNKLADVFSLITCSLPSYLFLSKTFLKGLSKTNYWFRYFFKKKLLLFFIRRLKKKKLLTLPNKLNYTAVLSMGSLQKHLYNNLLECSRSNNALVKLTQLRYLCVEPRVNYYTTTSPKTKFTLSILKLCVFTGKKVIVYSQFVDVLLFLGKDLTLLGFKFMYIDGKVSNRLEVCENFNSSSKVNVLLVSVKSAGLGFNITSASVVIHLDPWWNASLEHQGTDRAHRIGQNRKLVNLKVLMGGSIETRMLNLQKYKSTVLFRFFKNSKY